MRKSVSRAIDLGVTYFDTAPSYGDGESESNLGETLAEFEGAKKIILGTKVLIGPAERGDIRGAIIRSLDNSLSRLRRDAVDLLQLHNRIVRRRHPEEEARGDPLTLPVEEVLGDVVDAFEALRGQGKVRFFGLTGLGETDALLDVVSSGEFHTIQVCYNLLNPSAGMAVPSSFYAQDFGGLVNEAAKREMGVIAIRALAAGALSGTEARHPIAVPKVDPIGSGSKYSEDVRRAMDFRFLVEEGVVGSTTEAALRFVLSNPSVSTCMVGLSSTEQLEEAASFIGKGPLPRKSVERLTEIWERFRT